MELILCKVVMQKYMTNVFQCILVIVNGGHLMKLINFMGVLWKLWC